MTDFDFDKSFSDDLRRERFYESDDANWAALASSLDRRERLEIRGRRLYYRWLPSLAAAAMIGVFATAWWQADRRADALETRIGQLETQVFTKNETAAPTDFSTQKQAAPTENQSISTEKREPSAESLAKNETVSADFSTKNEATAAGLAARKMISENQKRAAKPSNETVFSEKKKVDFSKKAEAAPSVSAAEKTKAASDFPKTQPSSEADFSKKAEAESSVSLDENLENAPSPSVENVSKTEAAASFQKLKTWTALPTPSLKPIGFQRKTPDLNRFKPDFVVVVAENLTRPVKTRRHFAVGPTVGWAAPIGSEVENVSGNSIGLEGQFLLKKGWRLTGDVGKNQSFYEKQN